MVAGNNNGFRELSGRHVLVVEDCSSTRGLIARLLSREGAHVSVCGTGKAAVSLIDSSRGGDAPVDVVLMDMDLPVLDGHAATSLLRAKGFDRPIIAVTAGSTGPSRETCLAEGCDEYLCKPVDAMELIGLIQSCLERCGVRR
jgi:CheY-like chemotaxis protein